VHTAEHVTRRGNNETEGRELAGAALQGTSAPLREDIVDAQWIRFGEIELEGVRYDHDVVIDKGRVTKRRKKTSKPYRGEFGHTPLSAAETIPWGGKRLIVGTGESGSLPIMPDVWQEAQRRGIEVMAAPTEEALTLVRDADAADVRAILHVTC
jgi:hypothetical protein